VQARAEDRFLLPASGPGRHGQPSAIVQLDVAMSEEIDEAPSRRTSGAAVPVLNAQIKGQRRRVLINRDVHTVCHGRVGNVSLSNLRLLNSIPLRCLRHGVGKCRGLPMLFGRWHTIYTRMNRWSRNGVLDRVFSGVAARADRAHQIEAVIAGYTWVKFIQMAPGIKKTTSSIENPEVD